MDTRARLGLHPHPPSELQSSATTGTLGRAQIPALTIENMTPALNVETNTALDSESCFTLLQACWGNGELQQ